MRSYVKKKDHQKFADLVTDWIRLYGRDDPGCMYDLIVDTQFGELGIRVERPNDSFRTQSVNVYGRLLETDKDKLRSAALYLGGNPYSGKWNAHYRRIDFDQDGPAGCAKNFMDRLRWAIGGEAAKDIPGAAEVETEELI